MAKATKKSQNSGDIRSALRAVALAQPDTDEGVACAGTPLEKSTIKARDKAFVFMGQREVMLKLSESLEEAKTMAQSSPAALKVGARDWVTAQLDSLPRALLATSACDESVPSSKGALLVPAGPLKGLPYHVVASGDTLPKIAEAVLGDRKLAALGVHVERRVAVHGLALNVTAEASAAFRRGWFVPCGLAGGQVTSLEESEPPSAPTAAGRSGPPSVRAAAERMARALLVGTGELATEGPTPHIHESTVALLSHALSVE